MFACCYKLSFLRNFDLRFGMKVLKVAFRLDFEQRRTILLLAFLHPMTVDVERCRIDHSTVGLEAVRILEQLDQFDRLRLVLERLEPRYCHGYFNVDAERFARQKYSIWFRL